MYISLHLNSSPSPSWRGLQIFYTNNNKENKEIALSLTNYLKEKLQNVLHNVTNRNSSLIINNVLYSLQNRNNNMYSYALPNKYTVRCQLQYDNNRKSLKKWLCTIRL